MTILQRTLEAVRDEGLSKEQLEMYHAKLGELRVQVKLELSGILKEKALFMIRNPEKSVAQRKIEWSGGEAGQREIELRGYISALGDQLESTKTRIFALL